MLTADIVRRNCAFAQRVAAYLHSHPSYELLNVSSEWDAGDADSDTPIVPLNIVLFCGATGSRFPQNREGASAKLTTVINSSRQMYVTGTKWQGVGAVRLAVSNWRTGDADWKIVKEVLDKVAAGP
jgi:hypothetical protein